MFVKEIEQALIDRCADLAVHSIKDVPALLADGLQIGCVPVRGDPRDVLVSSSGADFEGLPAGSRVGTSSLRRSVLLGRARPDLQFVALRGNVDTRLRKVRDGQVDAAIVAKAGLDRLGLSSAIAQILPVDWCIPAVGQGALGIECRADDADTLRMLSALDDRATAIAVGAERGVMIELQGNCRTPIAAHGWRDDQGRLQLRAMLAEPDGSRVRLSRTTVDWPSCESQAESVGRQLGAQLRHLPC